MNFCLDDCFFINFFVKEVKCVVSFLNKKQHHLVLGAKFGEHDPPAEKKMTTLEHTRVRQPLCRAMYCRVLKGTR